MSPFERVSPEREQILRELARDALEVLQAAGLPQSVEVDDGYTAGLVVEIDLGDDAAGGAYVLWRPDRRLVDRGSLALLNGRNDDPSIKQAAIVKTVMKDAISSILASSGFLVVESRNDLDPLGVYLLARSD